jgi:hypothetical protein
MQTSTYQYASISLGHNINPPSIGIHKLIFISLDVNFKIKENASSFNWHRKIGKRINEKRVRSAWHLVILLMILEQEQNMMVNSRANLAITNIFGGVFLSSVNIAHYV